MTVRFNEHTHFSKTQGPGLSIISRFLQLSTPVNKIADHFELLEILKFVRLHYIQRRIQMTSQKCNYANRTAAGT